MWSANQNVPINNYDSWLFCLKKYTTSIQSLSPKLQLKVLIQGDMVAQQVALTSYSSRSPS